MRRVLVLGQTGMLGQAILHVLSQEAGLQVEGTQRLNPDNSWHFDVESDIGQVGARLANWGRFDVVINCIGLLQSDIDERDPESVRRAIAVNALFPHQLAAAAAAQGSRVILVSTDGVFTGTRGPYNEDDPADATDVYGKTKSLGDVRRTGVLTIRCSFIGRDPIGKRGLLEWFLAQPDGARLQGYVDYLWNGVTTLQFAQMCRRLIIEDKFDEVLREGSIHHFCPNKPMSKFELLMLFKTVFRKDVRIVAARQGKVPVCRVLVSRTERLRRLLDHDGEMASAVKQLVDSPASQLVR